MRKPTRRPSVEIAPPRGRQVVLARYRLSHSVPGRPASLRTQLRRMNRVRTLLDFGAYRALPPWGVLKFGFMMLKINLMMEKRPITLLGSLQELGEAERTHGGWLNSGPFAW